ncbi:ABC transporter substrate-binding protein [Albimonas pacifica]|uniref:Amino acid/amide ABC transporter substrate-binding protein, HAAT family n=1 Tax=Albimonas pacifica TaxID=1114924 RepID=A0A1I3JRV4_9RHOB|nr:ABC transporter substrate-binding protein [Albimonas pacifica]SFI62896.1 amino acid/amide ABC transporter substrate-binding protein, HAAT family [Albimonas pacifica]
MFGRKTWMAAAAAAAMIAGPAVAQDAIKIGNTMPYSGPASAYGTIGKTIEAYINKINAEGGVHGRQIEWISYDDGYSPPKTVEQVRRLVEQDEVDILFATLGTPTNTAIHKYVNAKKVPHLFVSTGASKWNDPSNFPMTTGWQPNYPTEGAIYAKYIMENIEDPKIAILYQNDDYGKDYLHGMKMGLGDKADSLIVAETPYEVAQPTVDSEVISLKSTGANVFFIVATPKFAAQAIKKSDEIGWEATRFLNNVSVSVGGVLQPAGLEASKGLISAGYMKESTDPQWADDAEMAEWRKFMDEYYPDGDQTSSFTTFGYAIAITLQEALEKAGPDAGPEEILAAATSLDVRVPILLPGIQIKTSETDFAPIEAMQLMRFNGESWEFFGEVIHAESS